MKYRTGFVSNSSATSFCIFGCGIGEDELRKILINNGIKVTEELDDEENAFDVYEYEDELKKITGLELFSDYDGSYWIGRSWSSIGDNETGKQFKDSVRAKLKNRKCETIEEAWMDG